MKLNNIVKTTATVDGSEVIRKIFQKNVLPRSGTAHKKPGKRRRRKKKMKFISNVDKAPT